MNKPHAEERPAQQRQEDGLSASVQVLPLPTGLYLFSVRDARPSTARSPNQLSLPAVHVGLGPGVRSDQVEFTAGPSTYGAWLFSEADLLVTRVNGGGATLILSSLRAPGGEVLSIKVERLDNRDEKTQVSPSKVDIPAAAPAEPAARRAADADRTAAGTIPVDNARADTDAVPIRIGAHVRTRGDMSFVDAPWAGRIGPGLWIESFSLSPLERFVAQDIEYKGLTGTGFETPWLSDEKMCGTKGMSVPLVGFAVRLKPSSAAAAFDCEYSGYFQSGATIGPLRNGAPCRSSVANDPLEGLQIRLIKRSGSAPLSPDVKRRSQQARREPPSRKPELRAKSIDRNLVSNRRLTARRP